MLINLKSSLILVALIILIIPFSSFSGKPGRAFCGFSAKKGYYYQNEPLEFITREGKPGDRSGIPDVILELKKQVGIDVDIHVFIAADEDNCFATIGEGGKRMIIADHGFLHAVNQRSGTRWAAISILAHELGHHIAGFTRYDNSRQAELDADYWSGYLLQKLGASQQASVKCIMTYGTESDSPSHPNKYDRSSTILQGWVDAAHGSFDVQRCESCE